MAIYNRVSDTQGIQSYTLCPLVSELHIIRQRLDQILRAGPAHLPAILLWSVGAIPPCCILLCCYGTMIIRSTTGSESYKDLILGGQVCMWAEFIDESNLEPTLWYVALLTRLSRLFIHKYTDVQTYISIYYIIYYLYAFYFCYYFYPSILFSITFITHCLHLAIGILPESCLVLSSMIRHRSLLAL
mgnify:CR=1 FL=1